MELYVQLSFQTVQLSVIISTKEILTTSLSAVHLLIFLFSSITVQLSLWLLVINVLWISKYTIGQVLQTKVLFLSFIQPNDGCFCGIKTPVSEYRYLWNYRHVTFMNCKATIGICMSNRCQILATWSNPSGILGIAKHIIQLTAGTLASVRLWPYGQWWGAAMTRNTPGKIPITECSSESQHLQKHDGPVVPITACQAADYGLSHVYLQAWCTCKTLQKQRQSDCLFKTKQLCSLSVWMWSVVTQPLHSSLTLHQKQWDNFDSWSTIS